MATVYTIPKAKPVLVGTTQPPVVVIAIDPGSQKYGYASLLVEDLRGHSRKLITCGAGEVARYGHMVTGVYKSGKKAGQEKTKKVPLEEPVFLHRLSVDIDALLWRLRSMQEVQYVFAIEQLFVGHHAYRQRVAFKAVGVITAAAGAFGWSGYYNPNPSNWRKRALGYGSADKERTASMMIEQYPELKDKSRFKDFYEYDDPADALGIATAAAYSLPEILGME